MTITLQWWMIFAILPVVYIVAYRGTLLWRAQRLLQSGLFLFGFALGIPLLIFGSIPARPTTEENEEDEDDVALVAKDESEEDDDGRKHRPPWWKIYGVTIADATTMAFSATTMQPSLTQTDGVQWEAEKESRQDWIARRKREREGR